MLSFLNLLLVGYTAFAAPILPRGSTFVQGTGVSFYSSDLSAGAALKAGTDYTCYRGSASRFPDIGQWASFDDLWKFQITNALSPIGDSSAEIQALQSAITSIGQAAQVDPRVILSIILQESTGNLKVGCTNNGVENCGIMQSHDPTDQSFNPANMVQSITQMIQDGVQGTATGPGLVQLFNNQGGLTAVTNGNLWMVLRAYNSGSINTSDLSNGMGATPSYVSDVANYLQGWQGWGSPARDSCGF